MLQFDPLPEVGIKCSSCDELATVICFIDGDDIDLCEDCKDEIYCSDCSQKHEECDCHPGLARAQRDADDRHDMEAVG